MKIYYQKVVRFLFRLNLSFLIDFNNNFLEMSFWRAPYPSLPEPAIDVNSKPYIHKTFFDILFFA